MTWFRHRTGIALAILLSSSIALVTAHPESVDAVEAYLHGLVEDGALSEVQHQHIHQLFEKAHLSQLDVWLRAQEKAARLTRDTRLYVSAVLGIGTPEASLAPVPGGYTGNGNVTFRGRINPQPPSPYYGDNSSTGTLYNGIWGYAVGSREYGLQANSFGLHIIDVTNPAAPFRVQYIDMSGGVIPPKGRIWRDVQTNYDNASGKTYAYVAGQSGANFWVVDLSYLSDSAPQGVDSNPIPPAGIADRGRTNYGHTVFVNEQLDLLLLNTANNGSTLGCQIFNLATNPFNPPLVAAWSGSGNDCHDVYVRANAAGSGKDLLYSADGYSTRYRVLDITNARTGGPTVKLGETAPVTGIYAHSNWLDDDARYLYTFEEFNVHDIAVYDVSNPASPTLVKTFQYSGDATANSRMHNGQLRGKILHAGYYEAGYRAFDISNPVNPVEVGKYETWRDPDGDGTFNAGMTQNYNGAWAVYAQLPSGNVLVSDMKSGMFILGVAPVVAPGQATGLDGTPGNGQVGLSWTGAAGATGYNVWRGTTAGGPYTVVKSNVVGTTYTDTGLTNGVTYYYVVSGTNAGGEGARSNEDSARPSGPLVTTTTTLTSSPNPSTLGQPVTFTATVTSPSGTPLGSVTFTEGATVWASNVSVDATGRASFTTSALTAGNHVLTAAFTGVGDWTNSSGTNSGAPHVVSTPSGPTTVTFTSIAAQDGFALESGETTNAGGSADAIATNAAALRLGDDNKNRQYRAIVSFDTSSIPDGATIVSVMLRLRRGTVSGTSPFGTHGTAWVDVHNSGFGGSTALQTADFQAAATVQQAASLSAAASNGVWSDAGLNTAGAAAVNKTGTTQFRVYFATDDDNDRRADYVGYYSGENTTPANRPQLVVTYQ